MAPIPVYTDSPIAAKPSGETPHTAAPEKSQGGPLPATTTASPISPSSAYPRAQPGAVPLLPTTIAAQAYRGPPPPQPVAAPTARPSIPPPPKAGEKYVPLQPVPYPQQMAIPPPTMSYPAQQQGTAIQSSGYSNQSPGGFAGRSPIAHPPGYHQNVNASEMPRYQQRSAMQSEDQHSQHEEGFLDTAKKWTQLAGEKLAAAENEMWKRINKE